MTRQEEAIDDMRSITRRDFNRRLAAALAAGAGAYGGTRTGAAAQITSRQNGKRPNFVVLVSDDHRADVLGCMGNPVIRTPNLDALAQQGSLFTNNFCTSAVCCSSRASILTGTYNRVNGVYDFQTDLSPELLALSYAARLREAGYRTGLIGKFGVGADKHGEAFDLWQGIPGQGTYFYGEGDDRIHSNDLMGRQALEFLDTCEPGQPFCLSVCFKTPHAMDFDPRPFQPAPRYEALYADAEIPQPPPESRAHYDALPEFLKNSEGRRRWEHNFGTPELFQRNMRDYYRLITHMDEVIGQIRQALTDHGWAENTVIVYTGDNGYCIGDFGLEGKWFAYEPSIRTPLIIFDPRAGRPNRVSSMALNIDLAPTILDLAGLSVPEAMNGVSLAPHLRGEPATPREDWFYEHRLPHPRIPMSEGIRTTRWKYIRWIEASPVQEELYDLEQDPLELHNVAEEHPEVLESLRARHAQYLEKLTPT